MGDATIMPFKKSGTFFDTAYCFQAVVFGMTRD
jgi:hypothetical protein